MSVFLKRLLVLITILLTVLTTTVVLADIERGQNYEIQWDIYGNWLTKWFHDELVWRSRSNRGVVGECPSYWYEGDDFEGVCNYQYRCYKTTWSVDFGFIPDSPDNYEPTEQMLCPGIPLVTDTHYQHVDVTDDYWKSGYHLKRAYDQWSKAGGQSSFAFQNLLEADYQERVQLVLDPYQPPGPPDFSLPQVPTFQEKNLVECLMPKLMTKFPFGIFDGLSAYSSSCPNVYFNGMKFEFCWMFELINNLKYPVAISLLIFLFFKV